jgi:hypothetical protein
VNPAKNGGKQPVKRRRNPGIPPRGKPQRNATARKTKKKEEKQQLWSRGT